MDFLLPSLYCLTSDELKISHSEQVFQFCKAGVRLVQLRAKKLSMAEFLSEAKKSVEICRKFEATLIINDSVDIAIECNAHGVHLGRNDMYISHARKLIGKSKLIGATIHSVEEIDNNIRQNADYIGMGPIMKSKTKSNLIPILTEAELLSMIQIFRPKPVYFIGGMSINDFSLAFKFGNHGIAVCSALSKERRLDITQIKNFVSVFSRQEILQTSN